MIRLTHTFICDVCGAEEKREYPLTSANVQPRPDSLTMRLIDGVGHVCPLHTIDRTVQIDGKPFHKGGGKAKAQAAR